MTDFVLPTRQVCLRTDGVYGEYACVCKFQKKRLLLGWRYSFSKFYALATVQIGILAVRVIWYPLRLYCQGDVGKTNSNCCSRNHFTYTTFSPFSIASLPRTSNMSITRGCCSRLALSNHLVSLDLPRLLAWINFFFVRAISGFYEARQSI